MTYPPVFDGHNDWLTAREPTGPTGRSFLERRAEGHLDLPRGREGGFAGGLFAVMAPARPMVNPPSRQSARKRPPSARKASAPADFVATPFAPVDRRDAQDFVIQKMADLFSQEVESGGQLKVVRSVAELKRCLRAKTLAAVIHFEGAEPIDPDLDALVVFHRAGLRSLGIAWSRPNAFGHGVSFDFPGSPDCGPGLTDAGRALVRACNELGILIDVSHLNEKGFRDVAVTSDAPLVATHSCAHALCPAPRNLTDRQIDAISASGGLIGVNFHTGFLREDGRPDPDTPLTAIVRQIDYIAGRIGIEGVALGSDFDGATMPNALGDAAGLPRLMEALRAAGYTGSALRKIAHENWLRVLGRTWKPS